MSYVKLESEFNLARVVEQFKLSTGSHIFSSLWRGKSTEYGRYIHDFFLNVHFARQNRCSAEYFNHSNFTWHVWVLDFKLYCTRCTRLKMDRLRFVSSNSAKLCRLVNVFLVYLSLSSNWRELGGRHTREKTRKSRFSRAKLRKTKRLLSTKLFSSWRARWDCSFLLKVFHRIILNKCV